MTLKIGIAAPRITSFSGGAQRHWILASSLARDPTFEVTYYSEKRIQEAAPWWDVPTTLSQKSLHAVNRDGLDVLIFGNPRLQEMLSVPCPNKFWLMIGWSEDLDRRFVENPRIANLACSDYLYELGKDLSAGNTYETIGGIDLEQFTYRDPDLSLPLGLGNMRGGSWAAPAPVEPAGFSGFRRLKGIDPRNRTSYYHSCGAILNYDRPASGWCNPVAEAMATGRPVLTNGVPCVRDLIVSRDLGYIYADWSDAKAKYEQWRNNPAEALRIARNARVWVSQYSWPKWVEKVKAAIFSEVCGIPSILAESAAAEVKA